MKQGCYVGPASTIYKAAGMGVVYKDVGHKTLTLTRGNHEVVMTNGSVKVLVDGKEVIWDTAPIYAKYKSSGKKRWIVPIKDVSLALGINYKVSKNVVQVNAGTPIIAPSSNSKVVTLLEMTSLATMNLAERFVNTGQSKITNLGIWVSH